MFSQYQPNSMNKVLITDDDIELISLLKEYMEPEGFEIDTAHDGESASQKALSNDYDIIVLDVMMPKMNGFDALKHIRQQSAVPILMLTARGEDVDRIVGLEMGADDYMPKPFNPRELVARMRAVLRRTQNTQHPNNSITLGSITLDHATRIVSHEGNNLDLTSTEFNLLEMLMRNAGTVISKSQLCEQVLDRKLSAYDRSIDMHLSNIRKKFGKYLDSNIPIKTVRGIGFMYIDNNDNNVSG